MEGRDFVCLHRYGYYGLFKPSVGEVLSQIKEYDLPFIKAFEIIESPQTAADFHKDSFTSIAFDNGVSRCKFNKFPFYVFYHYAVVYLKFYILVCVYILQKYQKTVMLMPSDCCFC